MARSLDQQAEDLYRALSELVRRYQFRDREEICCHGISVSQCYALSVLVEREGATMGDLAAALSLDMSTVTRVVDQLQRRRLVRRARDDDDGRVVRARPTAKGRALFERIRGDLVTEYRGVLGDIPVEGRESVLRAVRGLLEAFRARDPNCCTPPAVED